MQQSTERVVRVAILAILTILAKLKALASAARVASLVRVAGVRVFLCLAFGVVCSLASASARELPSSSAPSPRVEPSALLPAASGLRAVGAVPAAGAGLLAQAAAEAGDEAAEEGLGGWVSVVFAGGPIGVAIVLLLMSLSLISFYLVFDQILTLRHSELIPEGLSEEVRSGLMEGRLEEAAEACRQRPSLLAFVLLNGISELPYGWSSVEKALEDALAEQSARLYRKAEYLSVIGNIAPMVGLLGTVLGMVLAFQRVAESQGTASASELAEGIYQALITTVGGLIVAIPSLGAFAILRNRLDQLVAEAANVAQHVFAPLRKKRQAAEKRG